MELDLFVAWLEHPYPDPSLAAMVFLSLRYRLELGGAVRNACDEHGIRSKGLDPP